MGAFSAVLEALRDKVLKAAEKAQDEADSTICLLVLIYIGK